MTVTDFVPEVNFTPRAETDAQKIMRLTAEVSRGEGVIKGLMHRIRVLENKQADGKPDTAEIDRLKRDVKHWRDAAHVRAVENDQLREAARKARNRVAISKYRNCKRSTYQPRVLRVRAVG